MRRTLRLFRIICALAFVCPSIAVAQASTRVCDPAQWAFASAGGVAAAETAPSVLTAEFVAGTNGAWLDFIGYSNSTTDPQFGFWRLTAPFSSGYTVATTPTVHLGDAGATVSSTVTIGSATSTAIGSTPYDAANFDLHQWSSPQNPIRHVWVPPGRAFQVWGSSTSIGIGFSFSWMEPRSEGVVTGCVLPFDLPCDL